MTNSPVARFLYSRNKATSSSSKSNSPAESSDFKAVYWFASTRSLPASKSKERQSRQSISEIRNPQQTASSSTLNDSGSAAESFSFAAVMTVVASNFETYRMF